MEDKVVLFYLYLNPPRNLQMDCKAGLSLFFKRRNDMNVSSFSLGINIAYSILEVTIQEANELLIFPYFC